MEASRRYWTGLPLTPIVRGNLAGLPPSPGFVAKFLILVNVMPVGYTQYAALDLVGNYFYPQVIQFMYKSPDGPVTTDGKAHSLALSASLVCLAAAMWIAVFPGWVIAAF